MPLDYFLYESNVRWDRQTVSLTQLPHELQIKRPEVLAGSQVLDLPSIIFFSYILIDKATITSQIRYIYQIHRRVQQ